MYFPDPIKNLINDFIKLPGIGEKTAEKFVFSLLEAREDELKAFAYHLTALKQGVNRCKNCFNLTEKKFCHICTDASRDKNIICVVAHAQDIRILEKPKTYKGVYHVIDGIVDQLSGKTPKKENVESLIFKIKNTPAEEVILAFNPDMSGESTSLYLREILKNYSIKITRLGRGLPRGADLDYVDQITISDALEGRREI